MNDITKRTAVVLAAVAALAAGCSTTPTVTKTGQQSPQPAATQSTTQPAYDLAGFMAVLRGPEATAYLNQENDLERALKSGDTAALEREARQLARRASGYLAVLGPTNPPPRYLDFKGHMIAGLTQIRNGAQDLVTGIQTGDPAKIREAERHLNAGNKEYVEARKAAAALP